MKKYQRSQSVFRNLQSPLKQSQVFSHRQSMTIISTQQPLTSQKQISWKTARDYEQFESDKDHRRTENKSRISPPQIRRFHGKRQNRSFSPSYNKRSFRKLLKLKQTKNRRAGSCRCSECSDVNKRQKELCILFPGIEVKYHKRIRLRRLFRKYVWAIIAIIKYQYIYAAQLKFRRETSLRRTQISQLAIPLTTTFDQYQSSYKNYKIKAKYKPHLYVKGVGPNIIEKYLMEKSNKSNILLKMEQNNSSQKSMPSIPITLTTDHIPEFKLRSLCQLHLSPLNTKVQMSPKTSRKYSPQSQGTCIIQPNSARLVRHRMVSNIEGEFNQLKSTKWIGTKKRIMNTYTLQKGSIDMLTRSPTLSPKKHQLTALSPQRQQQSINKLCTQPEKNHETRNSSQGQLLLSDRKRIFSQIFLNID